MLLIFALLLLTAGVATWRGEALIGALALVFAVPCIVIQRRKVRARWCTNCRTPMHPLPRRGTRYERLEYRCPRCGTVRDSGVEIGWPE